MAKPKSKPKENVSERIREILKRKPDALPRDIAAELWEQFGLEVGQTYISTIKSNTKRKKPSINGRDLSPEVRLMLEVREIVERHGFAAVNEALTLLQHAQIKGTKS